uniref:Uncharacterized protein n=1 Tax=Cereibacter sphaeroides (strain ATCC 17025 / ATH 2.4.3) TaxID=349102 RepID=A4WZY8_CERS5
MTERGAGQDSAPSSGRTTPGSPTRGTNTILLAVPDDMVAVGVGRPVVAMGDAMFRHALLFRKSMLVANAARAFEDAQRVAVVVVGCHFIKRQMLDHGMRLSFLRREYRSGLCPQRSGASLSTGSSRACSGRVMRGAWKGASPSPSGSNPSGLLMRAGLHPPRRGTRPPL